MTILYLLIPLGLILVAIAVWAFFWAVSSGQFDDLSSPAWSVVMDDDAKPRAESAEELDADHADYRSARQSGPRPDRR
ncbi:MAG TPA: cbb3-type cytochrome oxidase assembly protein CcoS [Woeseiaceae bacterium]|nr:cbb3-type cytochrome oxidase assembly protein CcoS [Woeseiaceae bacterium]